jgi:Family of unknown function (DUF6491)
MPKKTCELGLYLVAFLFVGGALSEESDTDSDAKAPAGEDEAPRIDRCFSVQAMTDFVVISDQHVYIQTRGRNHYLMKTDVCKELQRSYHRAQTRFVPYGQTVCENDGSYIVYDASGRDLPCQILSIERVESRKEAKAIAESEQGLGQLETVETVETVTPVE